MGEIGEGAESLLQQPPLTGKLNQREAQIMIWSFVSISRELGDVAASVSVVDPKERAPLKQASKFAHRGCSVCQSRDYDRQA